MIWEKLMYNSSSTIFVWCGVTYTYASSSFYDSSLLTSSHVIICNVNIKQNDQVAAAASDFFC